MTLTAFASHEHDGWDQETGQPTSVHFGNALQVWAVLQDRDVTVAEAAVTFNTTPDLIRSAVEDHCWMLLDGEGDQATIQHDGE